MCAANGDRRRWILRSWWRPWFTPPRGPLPAGWLFGKEVPMVTDFAVVHKFMSGRVPLEVRWVLTAVSATGSNVCGGSVAREVWTKMAEKARTASGFVMR